MIRVLFFATIRNLTRENQATVPSAATVRELIEALSERYGKAFRDEAFEGNEVSGRLIVMVNGRSIAHTGGGSTPLSDGDTVAIFPLVGGG